MHVQWSLRNKSPVMSCGKASLLEWNHMWWCRKNQMAAVAAGASFRLEKFFRRNSMLWGPRYATHQTFAVLLVGQRSENRKLLRWHCCRCFQKPPWMMHFVTRVKKLKISGLKFSMWCNLLMKASESMWCDLLMSKIALDCLLHSIALMNLVIIVDIAWMTLPLNSTSLCKSYFCHIVVPCIFCDAGRISWPIHTMCYLSLVGDADH